MKYIIAGILVFALMAGVVVAVFKARRANREQSSLTMHPDNFKKPGIEQVEKINDNTETGSNTIRVDDKKGEVS